MIRKLCGIRNHLSCPDRSRSPFQLDFIYLAAHRTLAEMFSLKQASIVLLYSLCIVLLAVKPSNVAGQEPVHESDPEFVVKSSGDPGLSAASVDIVGDDKTGKVCCKQMTTGFSFSPPKRALLRRGLNLFPVEVMGRPQWNGIGQTLTLRYSTCAHLSLIN